MSEKLKTVPDDNSFVQTFRDPASRWAFMAMVVQKRAVSSAEDARKELFARYRKEIEKRLPYLENEMQVALAREISEADAGYFLETRDIDELRELVKKRPLTSLPATTPALTEDVVPGMVMRPSTLDADSTVSVNRELAVESSAYYNLSQEEEMFDWLTEIPFDPIESLLLDLQEQEKNEKETAERHSAMAVLALRYLYVINALHLLGIATKFEEFWDDEETAQQATRYFKEVAGEKLSVSDFLGF